MFWKKLFFKTKNFQKLVFLRPLVSAQKYHSVFRAKKTKFYVQLLSNTKNIIPCSKEKTKFYVQLITDLISLDISSFLVRSVELRVSVYFHCFLFVTCVLHCFRGVFCHLVRRWFFLLTLIYSLLLLRLLSPAVVDLNKEVNSKFSQYLCNY